MARRKPARMPFSDQGEPALRAYAGALRDAGELEAPAY